MNKEFVTFEIAKQLKEIGFDEYCLAFYYLNNPNLKYFYNISYILTETEYYKAPLWQQVIDWFRENYDIHINPIPYHRSNKIIGYCIGKIENSSGKVLYLSDDNYPTYYEARKAGIERAIEILKEKIK